MKLVVFLSDSERTRFKVACAKTKTSMSQQAHQLILDWLKNQEEAENPSSKEKRNK
ncbi:plasmid partition protein ParG [Microseira wollei]|uniref:plasmid partition protein ParG n=1 Tax=Microseira wollei TaxID=467598 RepID=UPI0021F6532A|nr:plasmid partition protein ParG [Microseira wollei]